MSTANGDSARPGPAFPRLLAQLQGWYYIAGGAWPLISPGTFQAVTGDKVEFWLVITVALHLVIIGGVLILAARGGRITREIALLGGATALMLAIVDVYCVTEPRTTRAYYLDALAEFGLAVLWAFAFRQLRSSMSGPSARG